MCSDGIACWPGEVEVSFLNALGLGVGRHKPEDGVRPFERSLHHFVVAVRSLHYLDVLAKVRKESFRVACYNADRLSAVENAVKDLLSNLAGGRGNDNHEYSSLKLTCIRYRTVYKVNCIVPFRSCQVG